MANQINHDAPIDWPALLRVLNGRPVTRVTRTGAVRLVRTEDDLHGVAWLHM